MAAFLASAVAVKFAETYGRSFITANQAEYLPFTKNPMLIYRAENEEQIRRALTRAKERGLSIGMYTEPLFATKGEEESLAEIVKLTGRSRTWSASFCMGRTRKSTRRSRA